MGEQDAKVDKEDGQKDEQQCSRNQIMKIARKMTGISLISSSKASDSNSKSFSKELAAVYQAATKNDAESFINVLERVSTGELSLSAIFKSVNQTGDTLLHVAASRGNVEIARLIVDKFPSLLTKRNSKGDTVWHNCARTGNALVFEELCNLRVGFKDYLTYSNNRLTKKEVTWEDLSLRLTNEEGNTALHESFINRHESIAYKLVKEDVEVSYLPNNQNKSALYLAAEAGYFKCLEFMMQNAARNGDINGRLKGKSLVHAAIMGRHIDVIKFLLERYPVLIDVGGWTPLHWAASIGFLEGVRYFLGKKSCSPTERDKNGLCPIHWASMNGYVNIIEELLKECSDNLLNSDGQNLLHVAAKSGQHKVVSYILKTPSLENLINNTDNHQNTPLHLAAMHLHSRIVSSLIWDKRVDLNIINKDGQTALDAAEYNSNGVITFGKWVTSQVLKSAGATGAASGNIPIAEKEFSLQSGSPINPNYKGRITKILLVSILVAVVSFGVDFTMPSGYNNSDTDQGMTTILRRDKSHTFIFYTSIAMCSFIVVAAVLRLAKSLLAMALTMMFLALMAVVYLAGSKLHYWHPDANLTTGLVFMVSCATLFFPLCFPLPSGHRILRYITYYPIRLMIVLSGSHTGYILEE